MDARIRDLPLDPAAPHGLSDEELLHALCSASHTPTPQPMVPAMDLALRASFGSVDRWRAEVIAMGNALGGGAGWVLLSFQPSAGRVVNHGAADHIHASAGGVPLLALQMDAHADPVGVGATAGAPVDACMQNIDWARVYQRYQQAVTAASGGLGATAQDAAEARLLDVRRAGVFAQADVVAEGAEWRDPAQVDRCRNNCLRAGPWSSIACMDMRSAAPQRCGCVHPGSMRVS